ncbi:hypothetical protein DFH06DRAFT_243389 [Mycena polygramma]|nr:hypothetical protein DFH06DRAFT_243389 [Mycena polygramma]
MKVPLPRHIPRQIWVFIRLLSARVFAPSGIWGGGGILYSRGPQAEQRVYGRQTSSTVWVVILTESYRMPTEHNIVPGGQSRAAVYELAGHLRAGPLGATSWDLATQRNSWCTKGVPSSLAKLPSIHQFTNCGTHVFPFADACVPSVFEKTDPRTSGKCRATQAAEAAEKKRWSCQIRAAKASGGPITRPVPRQNFSRLTANRRRRLPDEVRTRNPSNAKVTPSLSCKSFQAREQ